MSFTIGRTYTLVAGRDYSGQTNKAVQFKGTVAVGSTAILFDSIIQDPLARLNEIKGITGATPVISGPGFSPNAGITGGNGYTLYTTGATSTMAGTYDYFIYDSSVPSDLDSPVLAIHVLATPGAFSFKTLPGQSVTIPSGALVSGGIYDYGISQVVSIGTSGTILGLAPALRPFIV